MPEYIKAEDLKCKRTFASKLIFIAPIIMLLLAVISGRYFACNGYNWWYTMIFPGYVTLISALINQIEDKKLHYRAVFALPVSLRKTWIAKVSLIGIYTAIALLIHMAGIILGAHIYFTSSAITICQALAATTLILITSLWQIPLCLFLSKKFGMMMTILINFAGGIFLDIFAATKPFWWASPYSWTTRLMCPVLGILPNGCFAEKGDKLLNPGVIPVGIILSMAMFALMLIITANWFSRQEVK